MCHSRCLWGRHWQRGDRDLTPGDVIFILPETFHAVKARGNQTYIAIGAPQPPEVAMFKSDWKGR